jgi:mannosyltransferase
MVQEHAAPIGATSETGPRSVALGWTRTVAIGAGLSVLAVIPRLAFVGRRGFWLDEAASVAFAKFNTSMFVQTLYHREANMALYYILLRVWIAVFGSSEAAVRMMSVVASAATVLVVYTLAKRLFSSRVAITAAALLAVNAFDIRYAQEARGYSLVVLLVTLASYAFVEAVAARRRSPWIRYSVACVLAGYAHFFAGLVLLAHWVTALTLPRQGVARRYLLASVATIGIALAPLAAFVYFNDVGQNAWISTPRFKDVQRLLDAFAGGSDFAGWLYLLAALHVFFVVRPAHALSEGAALQLFVPGWRGRSRFGCSVTLRPWSTLTEPGHTWHVTLVLAWCVIPIAATFLMSVVKPMWVERYMIVALPALVMLAALGLAMIESNRVFALVLGLVLLVSGERVLRYYDKVPDFEDWKSVAAQLATEARPGDAIIFYHPYIRLGFEHYWHRSATSAAPEIVFPDPWGPEIREPDMSPQPTREQLVDLAKRYERVWLILSHDMTRPLQRPQVRRWIRGILATTYCTATEMRFRGIKVVRFEHPALLVSGTCPSS